MEHGISLQGHIVTVLKTMNSQKEFSGINGDKSFIDVLVERLFTVDELTSGNPLNLKKISFIRGNKTQFHSIALYRDQI